MIIPLQDRGLLKDEKMDQRKKNTYNMSHAQVGPSSYKIPNMDITKKLERRAIINTDKRTIDITKW